MYTFNDAIDQRTYKIKPVMDIFKVSFVTRSGTTMYCRRCYR
jgi:hypothetical protein